MESELQKILRTISPTLSVKVWISREGDTIMSPGLVRLLFLISSEGSLSAAAKHLDWSYRMAWGRLRKAEKTLGLPLVEKLAGNKGGLRLTQNGQELVEKYDAWSKAVRKAAEEESKRFFANPLTDLEATPDNTDEAD